MAVSVDRYAVAVAGTQKKGSRDGSGDALCDRVAVWDVGSVAESTI